MVKESSTVQRVCRIIHRGKHATGFGIGECEITAHVGKDMSVLKGALHQPAPRDTHPNGICDPTQFHVATSISDGIIYETSLLV